MTHLEAKCTVCKETFNPHSEEPDDLIHGLRENGTDVCGGRGEIMGRWVIQKCEHYIYWTGHCAHPECSNYSPHPNVKRVDHAAD